MNFAPPVLPRPIVHERIDQLADAELAAVSKLLMQIEAERLFDEVSAGMDEARDAGQLDDVEASLRAFRDRHPYR